MQAEPCLCAPSKPNEKCFWYDKDYTNPYHAAVDKALKEQERVRQLVDDERARVSAGILQGLPETGGLPDSNKGEQQQTEWLSM